MADNDNEEQFNGEETEEFNAVEQYEAPEEMESSEKTEEEPKEEEAVEASEEHYDADEPTESANDNPEPTANASKNDDDERKIFVGGLSWDTTAKDLREYFQKYGTVLDCTLKTDPNTGRSRGFGFVLFDSSSCVDQVVAEKSHMLQGKNIDPKKAMTRGGGRGDAHRKVFVGGVGPEVPETEIREYFSTFGKIDEIELPFDRVKNQRRAYVFISFESEEVVERVIANPKQQLNGKDVDVRKATPRSEDGRGRGGAGRGRGRGRGGYGGQTAGGYYDGTAVAAAPPAYDYSGYYNYGQGYGAGYAYPGYGYPGYDYSSYYGQAADWSAYQASYAQSSYPGANYDYSNWYGQGTDTQSTTGKAKRGATAPSYHPYNR